MLFFSVFFSTRPTLLLQACALSLLPHATMMVLALVACTSEAMLMHGRKAVLGTPPTIAAMPRQPRHDHALVARSCVPRWPNLPQQRRPSRWPALLAMVPLMAA
jgi:hypothetical protein